MPERTANGKISSSVYLNSNHAVIILSKDGLRYDRFAC